MSLHTSPVSQSPLTDPLSTLMRQVDPPVATAGRAYLEFEIASVAAGINGCAALLGVTAEAGYPQPGVAGLHLSPLSHLYFCRNSLAVCGDQVSACTRPGPPSCGGPCVPRARQCAPLFRIVVQPDTACVPLVPVNRWEYGSEDSGSQWWVGHGWRDSWLATLVLM
jgi:hypothetical protein